MVGFSQVISGNYKVAGAAVLVLLFFVYLAGLPVEIMVVDAAVYAHISMEMYLQGDYLNIMLAGQDWLDKPHLQFWIVGLAYELFGVSNVVYKLPALLFITGAAYYTFLFARRYYTGKHGWFAAIMLVASFHTIISNTDVRAEPYLTFFTIFSLYYLVLFIEDRRKLAFVLACAGLACLAMVKGPYTMIPVLTAVTFSLAFAGKWKQLLHPQWLAIGLVSLIFLSPSIYAYYQQFDLHPEKVVFGDTGISGVRFFLWDSQWGRFDSSGPITSSTGDRFFFVHTMLWAFAPWAVIAIIGLGGKIRELIKNERTESYTLFGFIPMFLIFSISDFQLPHYLNPLFPFLAIISADALIRIQHKRGWGLVKTLHWFQLGLLILLTAVIQYFYFQTWYSWFMTGVLLLILCWITLLILKNKNGAEKIVFSGALAIAFLGFYLNTTLYPDLIRYQSETTLALYLEEENIDPAMVVGFQKPCYPAGLRTKTIVPVVQDVEDTSLSLKYIFTDEAGLKKLSEKYRDIQVIKEFEDYRITQLRPKFVNRDTRDEVLRSAYLLKISATPQ